jgi:prephenate dehydratase
VALRVAYLGPPGTNSEVAALKVQPGAELVDCPTIFAVARAVAGGDADRGVVPVENSLQGTVTDTVDVLIHDESLAVSGELVLDIEHCLMAKPGTRRDEIDVIYSHPQSLGQCRRYLESHFPKARQEASLSNSEAAAVAMKTARAASIGPARAAEIYGAEIIERGIQDSRINKTRFLVLARESGPPTGNDKTSIAIAVTHDRPGTLVSVLHEFSDREINMTKVESRPSGEELGIYIFLIDVEGHRLDPMLAQALAAVKEQSSFFRVFGSYPAWTG